MKTNTKANMMISAKRGLFAFRQLLQDTQEKISQHSAFFHNILKEEEERELERLKQTTRILKKFRISPVSMPNPFVAAGFSPDENSWSDAIASIFRLRVLKLQPLKEIVAITAKKNNEDAKNIMKIIDSYEDEGSVSVEREVRRDETIPDIVIQGKDFLIYIENKIRFGSETFINGTPQTKRQYRDLIYRGKKYGLKTLGIFLSPEGIKAAEPNFAALSGHELAEALQNAVEKNKPFGGEHTIRAFIDTFRLLY